MNDLPSRVSILLLRVRLLFVVVLLFVFTGNVSGQDGGGDLFHWPGGEPFVKAIVTRDGTYPGDVDSDLTEMELRLRGILAVVTGRNLAALTRSCPRIKETVARPADAVVLYYLHLVTASGSKRTIGILQTPGGGLASLTAWARPRTLGYISLCVRIQKRSAPMASTTASATSSANMPLAMKPPTRSRST